MHQDEQNAPPFNHIPTAVVLVMIALAAVELVLQAGARGFVGGPGAIGWRNIAVTEYGVYPQVLTWMFETRQFPLDELLRFVTYPFIHASFGHLIFGFVLILAIGKMIAEAFSQTAFLIIFFASTIAGGLAYAVLIDTRYPLIGAYPPAYGLIGAMTFLLWMKARIEGTNPLRAFSLIGFLLGIQFFFGMTFGGGWDWVADFTGFVVGFLLGFPLAPGGYGRMLAVLERIRSRSD
jgi:rhomboid protease GluP